ncbi:peroxidase 17-like [Impatiens glandulifera]|uniref:peroxidase 17-like n=1 Tax=Impatiens glandulifera TaxID=253017 RepID=UPI001FB12194|nr:peroxidase 17-like [Impatiens glandulifera]
MFSTSTATISFFFFLLISLAAIHAGDNGPSYSKLRHGYYSTTCPDAEITVKNVIRKNMIIDPRSAASVMRFQFHDCFVNGCDASMLLDDTPNMLGEKESLSNGGSLRSYEVIDEAKANLEQICPGVVSCADIIIMAARDAVLFSGGPDWAVKLGRKDSLTASQKDSDDIMPTPRANATYLLNLFQKFNLSAKDLVALSGSHSIGKARCFSIVFRLYNQSGSGLPDPAMNPEYRKKLDKLCPMPDGNLSVTVDLDSTPELFDNQYFKDLVNGKGSLNSDQTLFTLPETRKYVERFSRGEKEFYEAFVKGMIRLGDLQSGRSGEIRRNCRVVNQLVLGRRTEGVSRKTSLT